MDSVDVLVATLLEGAVGHHGVLAPIVLVIDRNDHRVVIFDRFGQLEGRQVIQIKHDCIVWDLLACSRAHRQVVDVVFPVRCVEHLWRIVRVFLFSDAHVDSNVSITERIILESHLKLVVFRHFLQAMARKVLVFNLTEAPWKYLASEHHQNVERWVSN